ncbi:MAG: BamA/TamA family outer membrane protein [Ginsengibacter sp.]
MVLSITDKKYSSHYFNLFFISIFFFSGCTVVRKYQKDKPFVYNNIINLNIDDVTPDEKVIIKSRLNTQLDDSSKVRIKDVAFVLHYIDKPPVFDTVAARQSSDNMQVSMVNLGYYSAKTNYTFNIDSANRQHEKKVTTTYNIEAGRRTLIDTFAYLLYKPELQQLAVQTRDKSSLQKNAPVTKAAIANESSRLVDLFRNNGYYKFTAEELRVTGDTTIEALTTVSDDPFDALRLLAEANEKRNKPTIKLAIQLDKSNDSTRLNKYYINDIYILPDYIPGDVYTDSGLTQSIINNYIIRYHKKIFTNHLLANSVTIKKGDTYSQDDYFKTLNSFYKLGVWESPGIDIIERKDTNLLDLVVKLIPIKKYGFEGSIELSYSANSSTTNGISASNSGNLLGVSGNVSILNRNLKKQAIRMTNGIRAGVEFNTSKRTGSSLINSNEIGYSNNITIPKFVTPFKCINQKKLLTQQTFINTNISLINRINFFHQQIFNTGFGYNWTKKANRNWTYRPLSIDFRRLYNRSDSFDATLNRFPFLRYSFNTALVIGQTLSFTSSYINPKFPQRQRSFKFNIEESGLLWGRLKPVLSSAGKQNFLTKYLKQFIKTDIEYTYIISHPKSAVVFRLFGGVGIPLSKADTTLPFFKQYFGGGPNSMRGWPVRGIGVGAQKLLPYNSNNTFNDRTGDIQLEGNAEYRYNIAPLFSNAITLKGALFIDAGNIWNYKNTKTNGTVDSTQFKFQNIYKQLGVSAGTGFRLDFNYFLIRFDLAFRFKRPDITANDGWQIPSLNFLNLFGSNIERKRWRYENFNFTIGIDYPF